jgi:hypothetical protein
MLAAFSECFCEPLLHSPSAAAVMAADIPSGSPSFSSFTATSSSQQLAFAIQRRRHVLFSGYPDARNLTKTITGADRLLADQQCRLGEPGAAKSRQKRLRKKKRRWARSKLLRQYKSDEMDSPIGASSRTTSRSSGTNDSTNRPRLTALYSNDSSDPRPPQSSAAGSASVSDVSNTGKEKKLYEAKGKETKAPRGRGGGVPIKRAVAPSPAPQAFRAETAAFYPSSNQRTWLNFKIWQGVKEGMRPYGGFESVSVR